MNRTGNAFKHVARGAQWLLLAVAWSSAAFGNPPPPHEQQRDVKGLVTRDEAVFSAPAQGDWKWRLTTDAVEGWLHVTNTQRPKFGLWRIEGFLGTSGFWESKNDVTANSPDRHFQTSFYGELQKGGAGAAGTPHFIIEGRTDSGYYVLPTEQDAATGQTVQFWAEDADGQLVASTWSWSSEPVEDAPLLQPSACKKYVAVTAIEPGEYDIVGEREGPYPTDTDRARLTVIKVKIEYPYDTNGNDVIDDPDNEFSFDASLPALLQIPCHALNSPGSDPEKFRWKIEDIGAIKGVWNPHVDGDVHTGKGLSSTVTFTGMPERNSDFGRKTIILGYEGLTCTDSETIEVFFDPLARNNSGPEPDDIPRNINLREVVIRK